jgi:hypothetical protein
MKWFRNASKALSIIAIVGVMGIAIIAHSRVTCEAASFGPFASVTCITLSDWRTP